jgi:hypothetical protein
MTDTINSVMPLNDKAQLLAVTTASACPFSPNVPRWPKP